MFQRIAYAGLLLIAYVIWSVYSHNSLPNWLYHLVNWGYDFRDVFTYLGSWAQYQIVRFGIWGYVFVALIIIIVGFSSEMTRGTFTLLLTHAIRSLIALKVMIAGFLSVATLRAIYKTALSQINRLIKGIKG